jgi:putative membrane protein
MRAAWAAWAAFAVGLLAWTALSYSGQSVMLVVASLALAFASYCSCSALLGHRATSIFLAIAAALGWFAEEMGSTHGWFFGSYTYTDVLGPRLASVPVVIPLMWFGLCYVGYAMAGLILWRRVAHPGGWLAGALTALMAAMLVTAFDLGADPYFVYQLKAWIMAETNGDWFGETVIGFAGWMGVGFVIVCLFQVLARPAERPSRTPATPWAALLPILVYTGFIVFQVCVGEPPELRVIPIFAMGIPALAAACGWAQWRASGQARGAAN